jgi:glycosyltransferase involved in cell wall biosynthesis
VNVVIVAPCHVPLVIGGAEKLWWGLLEHLNRRTPHHADIIKLPGPERNFWEVVESYRRFSELDLRDYDVIVSGKYPAWMSDHPCHICYMLHPLRGLYDTYPVEFAPYCDVSHADVNGLLKLLRDKDHSREALHESFQRVDRLRGPHPHSGAVPSETFAFPGPLIREIVHFADRVAFRPGAIRRFCAISATVADRDGYFPDGTEVTPVHPPSDLTGFPKPRRGRYLLTVGRLDAPKRVDLLIGAMRHVRSDVELLIVGTGPDRHRLEDLAAGDPRIRFLGFVNDDALLSLYAEAHAVLFAPLQEDFGLVALEAMAAGKPIVTTDDAGGAGELVRHRKTGFVTKPEPKAIATSIEHVLSRRREARRMGARGRERAAEVTWQRVSSALLDGIDV